MSRIEGHDHLCPAVNMAAIQYESRCYCNVIARVRADERARWSPPTPAVEGHVSWCYCKRCDAHHAQATP